jgi:hypothetical protein
MASEAVLRSIDGHMARGNELMDRISGQFDRINEQFEENKLFLRDLLVRHERATERMVRHLDAQTARIDANTRVLEDLHEESVAQRGAILRVLDRLDQEWGTGSAG